ncbi:thiamine pyrophosphate-binding protein [Pseudarthrobacter sp. NPDC058196]|uniref:thiamine pyrophosphate-binding protein n=1 Tax=Pseudarthrobacter sp. NPDC058196 TaxID=3346376 RepID=UPI0036DC1FF2
MTTMIAADVTTFLPRHAGVPLNTWAGPEGPSSACSIRNGAITTGAKAIVWSLEELGISAIFGIPGGNVIPLYDALMDSRTVRNILTRHEQGAGHAAEGYAAASGRVGVAVATSGPGATNLITAVADAYFNSVPMLIITGQVSSALMGTDAFQEADILGMTTPITKHSFLVTAAEDIAPTIAKAHLIASTGRPGPVLVDITKDAQQAPVTFQWPAQSKLPGYRSTTHASRRQISLAVQHIREATRPLLFIGGGVVKAAATAELRQFVESIDLPVVTTPKGRGAFPEAHERHLGVTGPYGHASARIMLQEADLIIAIGTSLNAMTSSSSPERFAHTAKLIHADIDPAEVGRIHKADVSIVGDAKDVLHALAEAFSGTDAHAPSAGLGKMPLQNTDGHDLRDGGRDPDNGLLNPDYVFARISALTGTEAVFAMGAGYHHTMAAQSLQCNRPNSWLNSSTPGYGVPAAMGAKVAEPDRAVWAIDNDRYFQMTNQELATCTLNNIPIKVAIFNTSMSTQGTTSPAGPEPDLVKLAEAYGAMAVRVSNPEDIDHAIKLAMDTNDRTVVLDFVISARAMRPENRVGYPCSSPTPAGTSKHS